MAVGRKRAKKPSNSTSNIVYAGYSAWALSLAACPSDDTLIKTMKKTDGCWSYFKVIKCNKISLCQSNKWNAEYGPSLIMTSPTGSVAKE